MKKTILYSVMFAGLLGACQKNAPFDTTVSNVPDPATLEPGIIPPDIKLNEFAFHPDKHTWLEVDNYYRKEVKVTHRADSYFNNLRKLTIYVLVNQYNMVGVASYRTIDYYAGELLSIDLPDADVMLKVFKSVHGKWSDKQLSAVLLKKYNSSMAFIQQNFKDPQAVLNQESIRKYDQIKEFAESLSSKE